MMSADKPVTLANGFSPSRLNFHTPGTLHEEQQAIPPAKVAGAFMID